MLCKYIIAEIWKFCLLEQESGMRKMRFWHPQTQAQPNQLIDSNPNLSYPQHNPKPNPIFSVENTITPTAAHFSYPKTPRTQQHIFFQKQPPQRNPKPPKC